MTFTLDLEGIKVAVVDDERHQAMTVASIAREAGMLPSIISEEDGMFPHTDDLMRKVEGSGCLAVVCDHRLSQRPFASFTGAEFMAQLFRAHIPGVLLSTFASDDAPISIRLHRAEIPALMPRGELDPDNLREGLRRCKDELEGRVSPERQPWRVLVRVVGVSQEGNSAVVNAVMHNWDPNKEVKFPLDLIEDQRIRDILPVGFKGESRLFADVNIECSNEDDLFFKSFEIAPEPNDD